MNPSYPFHYAVIRIVPHEARGEFINAGVILFCAAQNFLDARLAFDAHRLCALAPQVDVAQAEKHLAAIPKICAGGGDAGALGELSRAERFRWLTAPRNTLIQTSPAHSGITENPQATLNHLVETLVTVSA